MMAPNAIDPDTGLPQEPRDPDDARESDGSDEVDPPTESEEVPTDVAEKPGSDTVEHDHADELADEWGKESFPASDPPAHY